MLNKVVIEINNLFKGENKMKNTFKNILRTVKSIKGNSLAEFATTTALMATLAATAAPKLSEMSEGTKAEKSRNEIDKIIKQGGQFYQDTADEEGRGRFPNQVKFNQSIGGGDYDNHGGSSLDLGRALGLSKDHNDDVMRDLGIFVEAGQTEPVDGWQNYDDDHANDWVSVFGGSVDGGTDDPTTYRSTEDEQALNEWSGLFGDEVLESTFQDGHYAYTVVAGGGTGDDVYPPVLYVIDVENATDFNNVLEP
jgi:hypothetical protein